MPILIKIGILEVSSYGVFLALAVLFGSFVVWQTIRNSGFSDEKVFDHLTVSIVVSFIGARIFFAIVHPEVFRLSLLRIFLPWQFPGFTLWGALIGMGLVFLLLTKTQKIPYVEYFDAYGLAMPLLIMGISLAIHFDGTVIGTETNLPIGLPAVGVTENRHPVGLYSLIFGALVCLLFIYLRIKLRSRLEKGTIGWISISCLGFILLLLAFLRSDLIYLYGISIDRVIATIMLIGPWGPLWIKLRLNENINALYKKVFIKNTNNPKNL